MLKNLSLKTIIVILFALLHFGSYSDENTDGSHPVPDNDNTVESHPAPDEEEYLDHWPNPFVINDIEKDAIHLAEQVGGVEGVALLRQLLQNKKSNKVKEVVAHAAGLIGVKALDLFTAVKALGLLQTLVNDKSVQVKQKVAHGAALILKRVSVLISGSISKEQEKDESKEYTQNDLTINEVILKIEAKALGLLSHLAQDKDRDIRIAVAKAAGSVVKHESVVGEDEAYTLLLQLAQDEWYEVKREVAQEALEIGGKEGLALFQLLLEETDDIIYPKKVHGLLA